MGSSTDEKILESAQRFRDNLPRLIERDPFLDGNWQSAEAVNVQLRKLKRELDCFDIFNESQELDRQQRKETIPVIESAALALESQDRLCGIDARQITSDKRSRT